MDFFLLTSFSWVLVAGRRPWLDTCYSYDKHSSNLRAMIRTSISQVGILGQHVVYSGALAADTRCNSASLQQNAPNDNALAPRGEDPRVGSRKGFLPNVWLLPDTVNR
jgi:hypothetical protein